jgi:hypothetical protein
MEAFITVLALLLLATPGVLFVSLVVPGRAPDRAALILGYGLLTGLVGVPLILRLLDSLGLPLSFAVSGSTEAAVSLALFFLVRLGGRTRPAPGPREAESLFVAERLAVLVLLGLIGLRVTLLSAEVSWRPLFPWDATMHWATKARVWLEHLELKPFVYGSEWLTVHSGDIYTDKHPAYPITIPLLQLWMTSALGEWNESLMNLPWLLCYLGLGAAFYGQAREAGASVLLSATFTYFLMSMPLLNTHVALAGYADLFLGSCYCLAIMAFHNWSMYRRRWQAVLAALFALACMLIKNEGLFWLLTLIPATLVVVFPGRRTLLALCGALAIGLIGLLLFPRDFVIAGHSLDSLRIYFRPDAMKPVFDSFFVHDSWHLFPYLLAGLLLASVFFNRSVFTELRGIMVALGCATLLFLFLFLFTAHSTGALRFTAVGRISLHLVPTALFLCLLLFNSLQARERNRSPARPSAAG